MAGNSDEINKIKKQLEDLKKSFGKETAQSIDALIKRLSQGGAELSEWKTLLDNFQTQADSVSDSLDYISKSLRDSVNELRRGNENLNQQVTSTRKLSSIADHLLSVRKGEISFEQKKIDKLKEEAKLRISQLRSLQSQTAAGSDQYKALSANISAAEELLGGFDNIEKTNKRINKELGATPKILAGIDKVLSKAGFDSLGVSEALDETRKLGQEAERTGDKGFKTISTFAGKVKDNLKESLSFSNLIQSSLTLLIGALKSIDEGSGAMAKSMNLTYSEALKTRSTLTDIANASYDTAVTTKGLQESYIAIGESLGSNAMASQDTLITMTKLREQAGYTNEQLTELNKLSLVNGKSLEQNTKQILGGAKAYASRKGLVINEKQVLNDVVKASASLKLSLGGSADALAESAVKARAVGLDLETAANMAEQLLNFESSIENELSAELLLGKDLNFERARQLALNNDIAGAAEEIANQVGTSADFAKMNAIQQESIAKAAGMTKDQLAQSLMDREALSKLSAKEGESAQQAFNRRVQEVGLEQTKKELGDQQLANQFQQQSVQERFTQTVEKLKEVFITVGNALMPVFDTLSKVFNIVGPIAGVLGQIVSFVIDWGKYLLPIIAGYKTFQFVSGLVLGIQAAIGKEQAIQAKLMDTNATRAKAYQVIEQGTLMIQNLKNSSLLTSLGIKRKENLIEKQGLLKRIGSAAMEVYKSAASIPVVGWILGGIAAAAVAALGYKFMSGDDIMSPGDGSSGYGKRTLFGPEGAIQLNNKDTVIAGTNLFDKADDMVSAPKGAISVSNSTAPKRETPVDPNAGTNARLDALIAATGRVNAIPTLKVQ